MELINVEPQIREELSIWKLIFHPIFWDLAGGCPVRWVAINIPIDYFGPNGSKGDIDLIFSLFNPLSDIHPGQGIPETIYRSFEVKSSFVHKNGSLRSGKIGEGKSKKVFSQLKKLDKIGSEMIFLLEIIGFENGMSDTGGFLPKPYIQAIEKKKEMLKSKGYGYSIKILEFIDGINGLKAGRIHPPLEILPASNLELRQPFINIVENLDRLANKSRGSKNGLGIPILFHCKKCNSLSCADKGLHPSQNSVKIRCNSCGNEIEAY